MAMVIGLRRRFWFQIERPADDVGVVFVEADP